MHPDPAKPDVYVDEQGKRLPLDEFGMPINRPESAASPDDAASKAAIACTPKSGADNPHRSSSGFAASGHGWWTKGSCDNNKADVYNCLFEQGLNDVWYRRDCSETRRLKPGGGAGNRTTARRGCDTVAQREWRNHVDVDVVSEYDTADKPMRQARVNCHIT